ncbi:hypothetical protein [Natrinema sp. 1APR25-10V2]|uniref:hypothetical protein n=1 Tax=Natrinema sp. 1APR25-10V2 TaxID=2951081 RepID=UPI0028770B41|nr:hypothetical protein [Natrinema sp. 1APR25-10V2]MDS0474497.1 hypothetical protein [Natrinema sp. 1APR25-10V2]
MTVDESGTTIDAATAVRGGAAGVGSFLLGYLFTFLSAADTGVRVAGAFQPLASAGGRFAPAWKVAGWLFLDGHAVGTRFDGRTVDAVSLAGVEFLYLVPPLLLVAAGALVAVTSASTTRRQGLVDGATVTVGYLLFVVVFAILTQHGNVRPTLLRALVVAGVAYPVAFGGLGGILAVVARTDR